MAKMFYKIGEVSKLVKVDAPTLRYWEKEFPFLKPQKNKTGQRIYSKRDLELVLRIRKLLYDDGYTVSGVRKKLAHPTRKTESSLHAEGAIADSPRAEKLRRARQLVREILEILDGQKMSE